MLVCSFGFNDLAQFHHFIQMCRNKFAGTKTDDDGFSIARN